MGPHVISLLKAGVSVVLDFPANTIVNRRWMRAIFDGANAPNELHFLDVSDDTCKQRLRERNAARQHAFQISEVEFELFSSYLVPPSPEEGFNVVVHAVNRRIAAGRDPSLPLDFTTASGLPSTPEIPTPAEIDGAANDGQSEQSERPSKNVCRPPRCLKALLQLARTGQQKPCVIVEVGYF